MTPKKAQAVFAAEIRRLDQVRVKALSELSQARRRELADCRVTLQDVADRFNVVQKEEGFPDLFEVYAPSFAPSIEIVWASDSLLFEARKDGLFVTCNRQHPEKLVKKSRETLEAAVLRHVVGWVLPLMKT